MSINKRNSLYSASSSDDAHRFKPQQSVTTTAWERESVCVFVCVCVCVCVCSWPSSGHLETQTGARLCILLFHEERKVLFCCVSPVLTSARLRPRATSPPILISTAYTCVDYKWHKTTLECNRIDSELNSRFPGSHTGLLSTQGKYVLELLMCICV